MDLYHQGEFNERGYRVALWEVFFGARPTLGTRSWDVSADQQLVMSYFYIVLLQLLLKNTPHTTASLADPFLLASILFSASLKSFAFYPSLALLSSAVLT